MSRVKRPQQKEEAEGDQTRQKIVEEKTVITAVPLKRGAKCEHHSCVGTECAPPPPTAQGLSLQKTIKVTSDSWPDKEATRGKWREFRK